MKQTDLGLARAKAARDLEHDTSEQSNLFPTHGLFLAGTGHRPEACGGFSEPARLRLVAFARDQLTKLNEKDMIGAVISGMALGWDQALAEAALSLGLPVVAAVPFDGQDGVWPPHARKRYRDLLCHPNVTVHVVCPGPYKPYKMHVRNEWMVDRCHCLMALFNQDLDRSGSGTAACVKYAWKKIEAKRGGPRYLNVWADWQEWCKR